VPNSKIRQFSKWENIHNFYFPSDFDTVSVFELIVTRASDNSQAEHPSAIFVHVMHLYFCCESFSVISRLWSLKSETKIYKYEQMN